jgi:hypothetical protein
MPLMMTGMYGRSQGVAVREFDVWLKAVDTALDRQARHLLLAARDTAPGASRPPARRAPATLHVVAVDEPSRKTLEDHAMGAVGSAFEIWMQVMGIELPPRLGERPRTTPCAPRIQISQNSARRCSGPSRYAHSSCPSCAASLRDHGARGRGPGAVP